MSTLIVFVVALIIICKWGLIKDAWNGKLPPPIPSTKKPWRYAGYNGWHRARRKNSFNGMKRFFKKSGRKKW